MTKPVPTGKVAQGVNEGMEAAARKGRQKLIDALYFLLGKDEMNAIENIKDAMDILDLLERTSGQMSRNQIHAARALLEEETNK